ncbi:hypothetical protein ACTG9Q_32680 [Actinokineospora sp. 24-640]
MTTGCYVIGVGGEDRRAGPVQGPRKVHADLPADEAFRTRHPAEPKRELDEPQLVNGLVERDTAGYRGLERSSRTFLR